MEFLPPANEVWGKVMFLHLCHSVRRGEGVCPTPPQTDLGGGWADPTPPECRPPSQIPWMQTPQPDPVPRQTPPGRPPSPPMQTSSPQCRPTSPDAERWMQTPPPPPIRQQATVRILLECILVFHNITMEKAQSYLVLQEYNMCLKEN